MNAFALALLTALPWFDLEPEQTLRLTQKIALGQAAEQPSYPAGTSLVLREREPLAVPGAPLLLLKLEEASCAHPEWQSELEIITPAGNDESSAVGVQVYQGCRWEIYLEQKDLLTSSFFSAAE